MVRWPQDSKNTNGPLKCLSGWPGWPAKIISENTLALVNHTRPRKIRVQGKCFLHLTLTRGSCFGCPIQDSLTFWKILKLLNYSYFAKIITGKPKIGNLTNMTKLYSFLESKKWYLLFKGILWSCDHKMKTSNTFCKCVKYWRFSILEMSLMQSNRVTGDKSPDNRLISLKPRPEK